MFKPSRLSLAVAISLAPGMSWAAGDDQPQMLEPMEIIGDASAAQTLPGSGYVVGDQQLKTEVEADISQVLKTVPGVYVREEEGQGLRPNIGIRGATAERSSNVTLMEDGVLIAPAPYSNPAAYYFPTLKRMSSLEVLKGAPLLRYGPQTTGGVINLISAPIPDKQKATSKPSPTTADPPTFMQPMATRTVTGVTCLKRSSAQRKASRTLTEATATVASTSVIMSVSCAGREIARA